VSLTRAAFGDQPSNDDALWSYPKFDEFRAHQKVFSSIAIHTDDQITLRVDGDAERVRNEVTDSKYFVTLGVQPILGRLFSAEEDSIGEGRKVVLLSHLLWTRRFNADSSIVGRSVQIGAAPYVVVGVMPEGFKGMSGRAELWLPLVSAHSWAITEPWGHSYTAVARLARGVSPEAAKAAVAQLGTIVDTRYPHPEMKGQKNGAIARELDSTRVHKDVRKSLLIVLGAVGLVLLIACANVANLFLVRAASRVHEIAVRMAVGATRRRLIRQLITECMLLSVLGGIAGVFVAYAGVRILSGLDPTRAFNVRSLGGVGAIGFEGIRLDGTALAVAAALSILTGLLFGVLPAMIATRPSLNEQLKNGRVSRLARRINSRNVLVAFEVALAIVLLAGSGLMIRSIRKLQHVSPGFDTSNMLTFRLNVREGSQPDSMAGFYEQVVERLRAIPGVTAATMQDCPPLNGGCNSTSILLRDRPAPESGTEPEVGVHWVEPNWHTVMGVRVISGRTFQSSDRQGNRKVVLVSEAAAKRLWPGQDVIGKPVSVGQGGFWNDTAYVVGVVSNLSYVTIDAPPIADVYISHLQSPRARMFLMVRTSVDPESLIPAVRLAMREVAPGLPVYDVRTMDARLADSTAYARFATMLLALFAAIALGLATLGTYGVIAFSVSQRTREIGIRMALGARADEVVGMIVRHGITIAVVGATGGILLAVGTTKLLTSLLYGIKPTDPLTFTGIVAILLVAVGIASWVPARRASRIPPTEALRDE
jgi:predicted permease